MNFDRRTSQIKAQGHDGAELTIQINVDLFNIKVFALLMCKGTQKEKADILFDLVLGPEGVKQAKDTIAWKSGRMVSAFKKLIFFSEIFPKKY